MPEQPPDGRDAKRRYSTAAMAQSVVPRGVGEEFTRSRNHWRRARSEWSTRSLRAKLVTAVILAMTAVSLVALLVGLAVGSGALVVAGGIAWALLAILSIVVGVAAELRPGSRR